MQTCFHVQLDQKIYCLLWMHFLQEDSTKWVAFSWFIATKGNKDIERAVSSCFILPWIPSNIFLVVSMIWFSYTDKLCIKILGFSKEIDWYHHHQQFLFRILRKQWKWHHILLFQLFGLELFSAHIYEITKHWSLQNHSFTEINKMVQYTEKAY